MKFLHAGISPGFSYSSFGLLVGHILPTVSVGNSPEKSFQDVRHLATSTGVMAHKSLAWRVHRSGWCFGSKLRQPFLCKLIMIFVAGDVVIRGDQI